MVEPLLDGASVSAVNWAEVLGRYVDVGLDARREDDAEALGLSIAPFTSRHAELVAGLRPLTRRLGLSLADRACLALALDIGARVVTADRAWKRIDVGVPVTVIR